MADESAHDVLALAVSAERLPSAHGPVNPICMLFRADPFALIGHTEWHTAAISPHFATVLPLDWGILRDNNHVKRSGSNHGGAAAAAAPTEVPLHVQIRHVVDPFWDESPSNTEKAVRAMPLLGHGTLTLEEVQTAAANGTPITLVMRGEDGRGPGSFKLSVRVFSSKPGEPWGQANASALAHSCVSYRFGETRNHTRVSEHMYSCAAGYEVPLAVLRMLSEDAHKQALARAGWPASAALKPGMHVADDGNGTHAQSTSSAAAAPAEAAAIELDWTQEEEGDPNRLLGSSLSAVGWAWHARWVDQALAQLQGAFQQSHGFKPSTSKASAPLAAMPINLMLNVLDVHETADGGGHRRLVHPTVSSGAFAAHSLGFAEGGAAEYESRLHAFSTAPEAEKASRRPGTEALALSYAKRIALLSCHSYAALAVSFAATCREHIQARRASRLAALPTLGFLVQVESLLSTRGDEWGMLQDLQVACRLLSRVRITVRPEPLAAVEAAPAPAAAPPQAAAVEAVSEAAAAEGEDVDEADAIVARAVASALARLAAESPPAPADISDSKEEEEEEEGEEEGDGDDEGGMLPVDPTEESSRWEWACGDVEIRGSRRSPVIEMSARALGFASAEHAAALGLPPGTSIPVRALLFTQGINEEQSMASVMRTHTSDQQAINMISARRMRRYVEAMQAHDAATAREKAAAAGSDGGANASSGWAVLDERTMGLLELLDTTVRAPAESKNIALLEHAAALTRRLGGGRVTMCKSGKDRTSMSLTLEHGRLLQSQHGLPARLAPAAVQTMRRRGVRRENVQLNTSKRTYAFNWLQQTMLPDPYRPPDGSAKGGKA